MSFISCFWGQLRKFLHMEEVQRYLLVRKEMTIFRSTNQLSKKVNVLLYFL